MSFESELQVLVSSLAKTIVDRVIAEVQAQLLVSMKSLNDSVELKQKAVVEEKSIVEEPAVKEPAVKGDTSSKNKTTSKPKSVEPSKKPTVEKPPVQVTKESVPITPEVPKLDSVEEEEEDFSFPEFIKSKNEVKSSFFDPLPQAYKESAIALSRIDKTGLSLVLSGYPIHSWLSVINGSIELDMSVLAEQGIRSSDIGVATDYLVAILSKLSRTAKKLERDYKVRENNLARLEAKRIKQEAAAKKAKTTKPVVAPVVEEPLDEVDITVEIYRPRIDKAERRTVGIVGLLGRHQTLLTKEFGNTFNLLMAETEDGIQKFRSLSDSSECVFVMAKFVSHRHTDNIDKSKQVIIQGGITRLHEALSTKAKEVYTQ